MRRLGCWIALLLVAGGLASASGKRPTSLEPIVPDDFEGCVVEVLDPSAIGGFAAVPLGPRTVVALVVDFADETVASTYGVADPVDFVAGVLYDNSRNTAGVIEDASFGATTLDPDADGNLQHDIFQVTIPSTIIGAACTYSAWANEADLAAQALGVDLGVYQHRMYVIPRVSGVCSSWAGLGQVGCGSFCRTWIRSTTGTVYAHEIGHNLGMHHASTDLDNDGVIDAEYGDLSDIMGSSSSWRQFNAPHKVLMEWVPSSDVVDLFGGGVWNFTLEALEIDPAAAIHPQIVRISRPDWPGRPYYLSYRAALGYDATLSSTYRNRLQVHAGVGSRTFYIDGLDDAEAFEDPVAHDLIVTQLSHDATTVSIQIMRSEPDLDGDGFGETVDCDDNNATVYPGAPEICDHLDNDCNELVDEGFGACDIDGDGFDELVDCNDADATVYPGAPELCDYRDNNCDGLADEPDYDGDGVGNCVDVCPDDPTKGGFDGTGNFFWCPCGVPEDTDSDGDSVPDCADNCPDDPDPGTADADGDGTSDCIDQCPNDPTKWNPILTGSCPCGVPDEDSDQDQVYDCYDLCPGEDDGIDSDIDGMPDCADACADDPWKFEPGLCGCGLADQDVDDDLTCDATENCPGVPNPAQTDSDADGVGDACDCGPGDAGNVVALGPATGLHFTSTSGFEWDPPIDTGGGAIAFDVLRSQDATDFFSADCLESDTSMEQAADQQTPATIFFYLVRVEAACGDHLGLASL